MEKALLEMLLHHGEDTKLDYKETVQIKSKTDYEGRAEFIRDILSIANAHEEETGYILIGVDENVESEDERIVDIKHLGLDDANIHAFVDEYISAPIPFSFRHTECKGKTIGVVEIPFSDNRFHFIAKDYKAPDSNKLLLTHGQCFIRRGSKKSPVTGYDMQRLKEHHAKQFANTSQPALQIYLVDKADNKQISQSITANEVKDKYSFLNAVLYRQTLQYPKFTVALQFAVYNKGNVGANNIVVRIDLPDGCSIYQEEQSPTVTPHLPSLKITTYALTGNKSITIDVMHLTHNLGIYSDEILITVPTLSVEHNFLWTAHAGNMVKPTAGKLQVRVG